MMRTLCLIIAALFFMLLPNHVFAAGSHNFSVKGYEMALDWEHKLTADHKNAFEISGYVTKGQPCKKLEVQVAFSNDNYKDNVPVAKTIIENFSPETNNDFKGEVPVETESEHLPSWGVVDYNVKCLE